MPHNSTVWPVDPTAPLCSGRTIHHDHQLHTLDPLTLQHLEIKLSRITREGITGIFADSEGQDCTAYMGPVFQSIVSLTSSLVVKMLTVLVSTISNSYLFLLKKMCVAFANAKATQIFSAKILAYMPCLMMKF